MLQLRIGVPRYHNRGWDLPVVHCLKYTSILSNYVFEHSAGHNHSKPQYLVWLESYRAKYCFLGISLSIMKWTLISNNPVGSWNAFHVDTFLHFSFLVYFRFLPKKKQMRRSILGPLLMYEFLDWRELLTFLRKISASDWVNELHHVSVHLWKTSLIILGNRQSIHQKISSIPQLRSDLGCFYFWPLLCEFIVDT